NEEGQLVRVIDAGGAITTFAYDEEHYLMAETRPDGLVYRFRYEVVAGEKRCVETWGELPGRDVLEEIGGASANRGAPRGVFHTRITYDPASMGSTVLDALGYTHRYRGNTLGLVTAYTDPRGHTKEIYYDANGNVVRTITADGASERATYDAFSR